MSGVNDGISLQMLTYLRIGVNVIVGLMLGTLYWQSGKQGHKVLDNYNLLFSILMHHMMSTMMLTILTCKLPLVLNSISWNADTFSSSKRNVNPNERTLQPLVFAQDVLHLRNHR